MIGILALAGRVVLVGYEKIVVKQLGSDTDSAAASFLFFILATAFLLPVVVIASPEIVLPPIMVATAAVYSCAFFLYVKALSMSDASLVGPLYNFNVFFLLILSAVFLSERVTATKVGGLIGLVAGASVINAGRGKRIPLKSLLSDRGAMLMILCSALMAVGRTLDGAVISKINPLWYAFVLYGLISGFLLLLTLATRQLGSAKEIFRAKTVSALSAGAVNAYSYVLLLVAFQSFEVSVVEPSTMLGAVVTVILARMVFGEKILSRLPGIAIMIGSTFLLFL